MTRLHSPAEEIRKGVRIATLGLAAILQFWAPLAHADPVTAEALFQEGRRLLDAGDFEAAAEKFSESQVQDPASGTLINLALCRERQGRLATAWAYYQSAAALARRDGRPDRVASAEQKIVDLAPRVPHLLVRVERVVPGMVLSWASVELGPSAFGVALPIDPGSYEVHVSAPSVESYVTTVTVLEGQTAVVAVPELHPEQAPPPRAAPAHAPEPPAAHHASRSTWQRNATWVAAGTAVLATGSTAYFGVRSLNAYEEAEAACPTHHGCSNTALDRRSDAERWAWVANISGAVAVVGAGLAVWFSTRPVHDPEAPPPKASLRLTPVQSGGVLAFSAPL